MAKSKKSDNTVEQYRHKDKERANNPPVGLVTSDTDKDGDNKTYSYDPHLDPQLNWAGKTEHVSFEVPTVSLHVHERIDAHTILQGVRKKGKTHQRSLFDFDEENPPLREAIEFYKHKHGWSNRLIAGDSLLVMNSLLEKEGMAGKVQMVYIDPPYGIKYSSNFQAFVNNRTVKDGKDEDLTSEPEQILAFRDTWELGIHSYLSYIRDRLLLSRDLLDESGSIFIQISDENIHLVRCLMDEIFGKENFQGLITFRTAISTNTIFSISDYILWYSKNNKSIKTHKIFLERSEEKNESTFSSIDDSGKQFKPTDEIWGTNKDALFSPYEFDGVEYSPPKGKGYKWGINGMDCLKKHDRLWASSNGILYGKKYETDFPFMNLTSLWGDTATSTFASDKIYVVQTNVKVVQRCILMTTDPGDLVLDITCGSGTSAFTSEKWGRRWITCDTSRVAIALTKQRLMTSLFDYYELAYPKEGVGSGFRYEMAPHVTLKSIATNSLPILETIYDKPIIDNSRNRISGPFTVEAVPSPVVQPLNDINIGDRADESIIRSGETLRQTEWKDELLKTGIRGKGGQRIEFTRLETLPGMHWLHADGTTKELKPKRIVASFGPEHAPLEQRQVERAIEEARRLVPTPELIVFAAFQFDPEASKDIDETHWPGVTLIKAQMNADLLTEDLKKEKSSNESFWLVGQPDVKKTVLKNGNLQVEVLGFDYYNTKTGTIESGSPEKIAMWMLDTDYDGRSLYPRQVFFPMAGDKDGWYRLAKSLNSEIDENLIEQYRGTISIPFSLGEHKRIAVKIIDDRGIESLRVLDV